MILLILGTAVIVVLVLGTFATLYWDLSKRLAKIESRDDAPHAVIEQVEEATIQARDLEDAVRRLGSRISDLESRRIQLTEERGAL